MRPPSCLKSPDQPCAGLFCTQDRTYLGLRIQKDGNEEVTEAFCVCSWTPEQLGALRVFVNAGAGSSPAFAEDLKRISNRPSRVFHLLHSMFGPEGIKRLYAKDTNRKYRQQLHRAGFDYPERPVPTGPRPPGSSEISRWGR